MAGYLWEGIEQGDYLVKVVSQCLFMNIGYKLYFGVATFEPGSQAGRAESNSGEKPPCQVVARVKLLLVVVR